MPNQLDAPVIALPSSCHFSIRPPALLEKIAARGLPNLFIPRRDHFIRVDKLPVLGTGKLDLRKLKRIAMEKLGPSLSSSHLDKSGAPERSRVPGEKVGG